MPQAGVLPGGRLHLQHGPIDLVIKAEGDAADISRAYGAADERFQPLLGELAGELALLRRPLAGDDPPEAGSSVARRMIAACWPHRTVFITPMAAVAGAVADEIMTAMLEAAPRLRTLYVNNGGDIAVHVGEDAMLRIGLVPDLARAAPEGVLTVTRSSAIGGIATSGWRGRSFSLGIADAVTALAASAAAADAAATVIANAVNAQHPAIRRAPACTLEPDSDLGDLAVTTAVGPLPHWVAEAALAAGCVEADRLRGRGHIHAAALALQGRWRFSHGPSGLFPGID